MNTDPFGSRSRLKVGSETFDMFRLDALPGEGARDPANLPHTIKILLENLLRRAGTRDVTEDDIHALSNWPDSETNIAFMPARVLMQDFTGVPAVVDLAALRSAMSRAGKDPQKVNPAIPVDLIIDHSVQVDGFGTNQAYRFNIEWEYRRNRERYSVLNWAQQAFNNFSLVPPGMGICHQVNLEYLGRVVQVQDGVAMPDTLVGTDSHTPMVNGLGVLGWGVGGIEAEAAILGQPVFLTKPDVVGIRTSGALPTGTTATDLVLTITEMLREHGVVGKFVEFFGEGLSTMTVADRATISNMSPESGATATLFPVDSQTLTYLRSTNRGDIVELVEAYTKEQGLFRSDGDPDPNFTEVLDLDLSRVEPSLAGPRRPQDRSSLAQVWSSFQKGFEDRLSAPVQGSQELLNEGGIDVPKGENATASTQPSNPPSIDNGDAVSDGSVVIAAITSCTNTSNPTVMVAAGLLAKKAVESGLASKPWVKTSLAPGSRVVTKYLDRAGLTPYLEKLGFNLVGYGCTTCIGNSGPLPEEIAEAVDSRDLTVASVLSGNRNFEGRIHPQVMASYLASPPLVVAYALAGHLNIDLTKDAIGEADGEPIMLSDIWPSAEEIQEVISSALSPEDFAEEYGRIYEGDENWAEMEVPKGEAYEWDDSSTYIAEPPFFEGITSDFDPPGDLTGARVLALLGDSVTTDHISPAGAIKVDSPAGRYLKDELGVDPRDFNTFGARRGNHEVMLRGTFGNVRIKNQLAPGTEGPLTTKLPEGAEMSVFDAAEAYRGEGTPLVVLAGKEYGSGSSRDWAAKGTYLLGVKAVIAESFERIHRSNLIGMGVLPLQFSEGESVSSLGLTGHETFDLTGIAGMSPGKRIHVRTTDPDGNSKEFEVSSRIDAAAEVDYYSNGGILQMVLRQML